MTDISLRQLLEAGAHFGHQACNWNPKMAPYIFGVRHKIHIINLEKTLKAYNDAVNFLGSVAAKKGKILFVGTKTSIRSALRDEAIRCDMPYVNHRWLGGMLTNYKTIRQSIKRFKDLEALRDSPVFASFSKKEALTITRKIAKMEKSLGGIKNMAGLPDAVFVIDVGHDNIAVSEASKLRIPIVGIVDSNNSPDGIDYVIPGNDDSLRAGKRYLQGMVDTIVAARGSIIEEEIAKEREDKRQPKKLARPKKKVVTRKITSDPNDDGDAEKVVEEFITEATEDDKPKVKTVKAAIKKK